MKSAKREVVVSEDLSAEDVFRQAIALGTGDLLRTSLNVYAAYISTELDDIQITEEGEKLINSLLDKKNSGFSNRRSFRRILLSTLAQDIMFMIWRESEFIVERALSEAGLCCQFQHPSKFLTRNSLKNIICDDKEHLNSSDGDALKRSIDRICDALEVYGLIERTRIRTNLKPIRGTHCLHTLMSGAHTAVSHVFARQLQTDEGAHNG